jgi:protein-arginine kinase activator protein McsA
MKPLKLHSKVVALTSKECNTSPRTAGKEYTILGVNNCRSCNEQWVCIDNKSFGKNLKIVCSSCGYDEVNSNIPWVSAKHFKPVEEVENKEVLLIKLNNAIQTENYEEAAKLRDIINQI